MKKITLILLFIFSIISFSLTIAGENNTESFKDVILDKEFRFEASLKNGIVNTSWDTFYKGDEFKWYKIIRSSTNSNPVYPDDGAIKYSDNINETQYKDYKPLIGKSYYRICAITINNNRYCSNVEEIYNEQQKTTMCTMEYAPVCGYKNGVPKTYSNKCMLKGDSANYEYNGECKKNEAVYKYSKPVYNNENKDELSWALTLKANKVIDSFINKLDSKDYSDKKKVGVIDKIISKLKVLEIKKPASRNLISYLIDSLREKKSKYDDDFLDIENIFNIN